MNEELILAIDELRKRSAESKWFIPVRLDESLPPALSIGCGETLRSLHAVSLHEDWDDGVNRLLHSLGHSKNQEKDSTDSSLKLRQQSLASTGTFTGEPVEFNLSGVPLKHLVERIAELFDQNIVIYPSITPEVSIRAKLPWDEALFRICRDVGFGFRREGALIRLAPFMQLQVEDRDNPVPSSFAGEPLSLRLEKASLFETLRATAEAENLNLYRVVGLADAALSINLKNVPLDQVRDLICRMHNLVCRVEGPTLVVESVNTLRASGERRFDL